MNALLLIVALFCGQFDTELAIAIAVNTPQATEQSVVASDTSAKPVAETPKQEQFIVRQEIRYRKVKRCFGSYCRWVREAYTVTVRGPVNASWPHYPTTNKAIWRLNGGRGAHANWQHLTQGEHAKQRFDSNWLQSLSQPEIEALHADLHEGTLKSGFIVTRK